MLFPKFVEKHVCTDLFTGLVKRKSHLGTSQTAEAPKLKRKS